MRDSGVSQLPVGKGEMPLTREIAGSVSVRLMELAFETDAVLDKTVEDVVAAPLPIGAGQLPVALAVGVLESCSAMLVLDGAAPVVVSRPISQLPLRHPGA